MRKITLFCSGLHYLLAPNRIKGETEPLLWLSDIVSLIYPRICVCCGNSLWKHEKIVCNACGFRLPKTNNHLEPENPVSRVFHGRVPVESAAAFLLFNKGNKVQLLIHHLKYKGRKDVGIWLGEEYGKVLRHSPSFTGIDLIIPVPLHKKRLMQRGYNQSDQFAKGLSKWMQLPVENKLLVRNRATATQTRKGRFDRWKNVEDIFSLNGPERISGRHVLLVDDVITTGATLESCIAVLRAVPGVRVSVATIATAKL
jgi:ComF family protein